MKKFYCFRGDKEDLNDIVKDINIKKYIETKIFWGEYVLIGFNYKFLEEHASYLVIKYGDLIINETALFGDRSPVLYKDYGPLDLENPDLLNSKRTK